jgi:hypothetical protein|tara:strand:- start:254 stop:397 length:144 start_codon:yes stop_codon:yes gene_type:complete
MPIKNSMANGGLIGTLIGAGVAIHATKQVARVVEKGIDFKKMKRIKF